MSARRQQREEANGSGMPRLGVVLSLVLHVAIAGALILASSRWWTTEIVAAGPGEGGEGGGGAIDVGVADASALFGFAKPQPVSNIGDRNDAINNTKVEHVPKEDENDEVIPRTDKEQVDPKSIKTDRPVAN